jgi:intraflagellar transport protein 74
LEDLKRKEHVTRGVTHDAQKKNQEIKEQLRNNENFRQISHLEEKLSDLLKNNSILQELVEQLSKEYDYSALKREVDEKVSTYNRMLYADLYGNNNRVM